ncbi:MAG: type II toxin-antitoxin system RelE/ParE family toxin [Deferribacteres bacterium]|nr:type II toxin-antitoxin system RelE/ParE family toxin [candidate division KSB1 bacterium]MCB9501653.1 type II toxin-antitoxin system RelE/ParE family toxin [Deferribacteres bacterium]
MSVFYTRKAKCDLEAAFEWYEMQRRGLGFDFLDCIENAIKSIISFPEIYQISHSSFRRCTIRRFPFSIFYTIEANSIIVHAVFNDKQDPQKRP